MRYELGLHRFLLSMMVALLAMFVMTLFYLNSHAGEEHFEATLSLIVVIVVTTIFAYMGTVEGIIAFYFGIKHSREFIAYLALGLLSVASALYLAMSQEASLQMVSLIASPHAFLFGLAELRIAWHMEGHPRERNALIACGLGELMLGIGLVWGSTLSNDRVAEILGGVALLTILQLLPILFYREIPNEPHLKAN